jgi:cation transport ATPase
MSNAGNKVQAGGGASALPVAAEPGVRADQALVNRAWQRIGAGCLVAGQAMVFSLAVNLSEIDGWAYVIVHGVLIAAALGVLAFFGRDLMSSAWRSARERRVSIDLLFLGTLLGALGGSPRWFGVS